MPDMNVAMEVERVMNLVRGFGWEKIKEERIKGHLDITIRKMVGDSEEVMEKEEGEGGETAGGETPAA